MARMPQDAVLLALGYLGHRDVGLGVMPTCHALFRVCDSDAVWVPMAVRILNTRLCLNEDVLRHVSRLAGQVVTGPPETLYKEQTMKTLAEERESDLAAYQRATPSRGREAAASGTGRQLLKEAFLDAKRATITAEELSRFRFHMKMRLFDEMRPFISGESLLPESAPPIHVHFEQDHRVFTEVHPLIGQWSREWQWVPPRRTLVPDDSTRGGFRYGPLEELTFSCLSWTGRPPLKVWRHPANWHVLMTHIHLQYCTYLLGPVGTGDEAVDNDRAYIHPFNVSRAALPDADTDEDDDDDDASGAELD